MLELPLYQVDAYAEALFRGNPAAVCILPDWLADETLQAIAAENHLSETAFVVQAGGDNHIRWFTPRHEVVLCGHATLAAGFVLSEHLAEDEPTVRFRSPSGPLTVTRLSKNRFGLELPAFAPEPMSSPPPRLLTALDVKPSACYQTRDDPNYLIVLESVESVERVRPDMRALEGLHPLGVAVTAASGPASFVSRYFAPSYGIPEDPATGSVQAALGPLWAKRLGVSELQARQLSPRGGLFELAVSEDTVTVAGGVAPYLVGTIHVPDSRPEEPADHSGESLP